MAALFDFNGSGRLGRERNLRQGVGERRLKIRRSVRVVVKISPSPPPPPTATVSISKSNMAGLMNDCELLEVNSPQ